MDKLTVVAGLGNPGNKYDGTRHNVGFGVVDLLAEKYGIKVNRLKFKAMTGEGTIGGERVLIVKPQTFMNLSGESLREVVEWYKLPVENLIVVYDDVDLPVGTIRIRPKGSSGTHNGMKSVIYQLQSDGFPRIRVGIGKAPAGWDLADYVLSRFSAEEADSMRRSFETAADATAAIISSGIASAMNNYNGEAKAK